MTPKSHSIYKIDEPFLVSLSLFCCSCKGSFPFLCFILLHDSLIWNRYISIFSCSMQIIILNSIFILLPSNYISIFSGMFWSQSHKQFSTSDMNLIPLEFPSFHFNIHEYCLVISYFCTAYTYFLLYDNFTFYVIYKHS